MATVGEVSMRWFWTVLDPPQYDCRSLHLCLNIPFSVGPLVGIHGGWVRGLNISNPVWYGILGQL